MQNILSTIFTYFYKPPQAAFYKHKKMQNRIE